MKIRERNYNVDMAKFICSFMILFLHTINIGKPYENILMNFCCNIIYNIIWLVNPVEFFFIVGSYYVFLHLENNGITHYIKRLSLLYLIWSVPYIMKDFINYYNQGALGFLRFIRRFFLIGSAGHMWYMIALVYGMILITSVLKLKNGEKIALVSSAVLYLVALCGDSYYNLVKDIPIFSDCINMYLQIFKNTYLLRAPIFIVIGYKISKIQELNKISSKQIFLFWLLFGILGLAELGYVKKNNLGLLYSITIFKPIVSFYVSLFVLLLPIRCGIDLHHLGNMSTIIYFSHILIRNIVEKFIANMYAVFFVTGVLSLLIAFWIISVSESRCSMLQKFSRLLY